MKQLEESAMELTTLAAICPPWVDSYIQDEEFIMKAIMPAKYTAEIILPENHCYLLHSVTVTSLACLHNYMVALVQ